MPENARGSLASTDRSGHLTTATREELIKQIEQMQIAFEKGLIIVQCQAYEQGARDERAGRLRHTE